MIENISSKINFEADSTKAEKEVKNLNAAISSLKNNVDIMNKSLKYSNTELEKLGLNYKQFLGVNKQFSAGTPYVQANKSQITASRNNQIYGPANINTTVLAEQSRVQDKLEKDRLAALKLTNAELYKQEVANKQLIDSQNRLNNVLGVTQAKIMANYVVFNQLSNAFRFIINYTVQLDDELRNLQAISRLSDSSLAGLKDTLIEVSNSSRFTSLEVAKTATVLAQAGLSLTQMEGALPAITRLATATGTDLATATDVVTSTLGVYNLQVTEAVQVTNALTTAVNESKADIGGFQQALQYAGNFAAQLNITYQEQAALIAAATQAGIRSRTMLGTGQRAVFAEFIDPTPKLQAQLEKLGLTLEDVDIKALGLIPVLKNLKDAGFSASDAYQSMDLRAANFLSSVLTQTDFMDELTYKMSLSTAAFDANDDRMKSLSSTWAQFQSIAGSAASKGLEPVVASLQSMLEVTNKFLASGGANGIFSILFGTLSISAGVATLGLVATSIGNIAKQLAVLRGASAATGALGGLGALAAIPVAKVTAIVTAIGLLTAGFYAAAKAMGLFNGGLDESLARTDELKGQYEELKTQNQVIGDYLTKLTENTKKFGNQRELSKVIAEIITRFPEMSKVINTTTTSFDELIQALEDKRFDLGAESIENLSKSLVSLKENAREALKEFYSIDEGTTSTWTERWFGGARGREGQSFTTASFGKDLQFLQSKGVDVSGVNQVSSRGLFESTSDYGNRVLTTKMENLTKILEDYVKSSNDPYALANLRGQSPELDKILTYVSDIVQKQDQLISQQASQVIGSDTNFSQNLEELNTSLQEVKTSYDKNNNELGGVRALSDKGIRKQLESDMRNQLTEALALRDRIALPAGSLKDRAQYAAGGSEEALAELMTKIQKESGLEGQKAYEKIIENYEETSLSLLTGVNALIEKISKKLGLDTKSYDSGTSEIGNLINSRIKDLRGTTPGDDQDKKIKQVEQDIQFLETQLLARQGLTRGANYTTGSKEALALQDTEFLIVKYKKDLKEAVAVSADAFDKINMSTEVFFKNLSRQVSESTIAYEKANSEIDRIISGQQGRVSGLEQRYGSGSIIAQAAGIRADNSNNTYDATRLANDTAYRNALQASLTTLLNDPQLQDLRKQQEQAQAQRDRAALSGNTRVYQSADKKLTQLATSLDKAAREEEALTTQIAELDVSIYELKEKITAASEGTGNSSLFGQVNSGFQSGMQVYQDESRASLGMENFTGELTVETLRSLDTGFADMFSTIINGSANAGEAFEAFGKKVLDTIADIALQAAVTGVMNSILGAFSGGGGASSATSSAFKSFGDMDLGGQIATAPTSVDMGGFFDLNNLKFAQGGLVNGPVKNRDSVSAMLTPGEYVLKKSAVDTLGTNFLDGLNTSSGTMVSSQTSAVASAAPSASTKDGSGGAQTTNIWVVLPEEKPVPGEKDIVLAVSQDMRKGGVTKQLVKQISMGG